MRNQVQANPSTKIIPSSYSLEQMIARAMSACDQSIEQAKLAKEAREEERAARAWASEAEANRRRKIWGRA